MTHLSNLDGKLRFLVAQAFTVQEIAVQCDVLVRSVRHRCQVLGLRPRHATETRTAFDRRAHSRSDVETKPVTVGGDDLLRRLREVHSTRLEGSR